MEIKEEMIYWICALSSPSYFFLFSLSSKFLLSPISVRHRFPLDSRYRILVFSLSASLSLCPLYRGIFASLFLCAALSILAARLWPVRSLSRLAGASETDWKFDWVSALLRAVQCDRINRRVIVSSAKHYRGRVKGSLFRSRYCRLCVAVSFQERSPAKDLVTPSASCGINVLRPRG